MEDNSAVLAAEKFATATVQADLVFLGSSESSLLFWHFKVPERTTINQLSHMLLEIVGRTFRAYADSEKLLILLEGYADEYVRHQFNIVIQALEKTRHKPEPHASSCVEME